MPLLGYDPAALTPLMLLLGYDPAALTPLLPLLGYDPAAVTPLMPLLGYDPAALIPLMVLLGYDPAAPCEMAAFSWNPSLPSCWNIGLESLCNNLTSWYPPLFASRDVSSFGIT